MSKKLDENNYSNNNNNNKTQQQTMSEIEKRTQGQENGGQDDTELKRSKKKKKKRSKIKGLSLDLSLHENEEDLISKISANKSTASNNGGSLSESTSTPAQSDKKGENISNSANTTKADSSVFRCDCKPPSPKSKSGHVELFLPKRLPCTCGQKFGGKDFETKFNYNDITPSNDVLLEEILRPWQVRFLRDMFHITKASQLIGLYDNVKTKILAKVMIKWLKRNGITIPVPDASSRRMADDPYFDDKEANRTACKTALHIWTKSCKTVLLAHQFYSKLQNSATAESKITPTNEYKTTSSQDSLSNNEIDGGEDNDPMIDRQDDELDNIIIHEDDDAKVNDDFNELWSGEERREASVSRDETGGTGDNENEKPTASETRQVEDIADLMPAVVSDDEDKEDEERQNRDGNGSNSENSFTDDDNCYLGDVSDDVGKTGAKYIADNEHIGDDDDNGDDTWLQNTSFGDTNSSFIVGIQNGVDPLSMEKKEKFDDMHVDVHKGNVNDEVVGIGIGATTAAVGVAAMAIATNDGGGDNIVGEKEEGLASGQEEGSGLESSRELNPFTEQIEKQQRKLKSAPGEEELTVETNRGINADDAEPRDVDAAAAIVAATPKKDDSCTNEKDDSVLETPKKEESTQPTGETTGPPSSPDAQPKIYDKLQRFENKRRLYYVTQLKKYKTEWQAARATMREGMNENLRAERMAIATCIANDAYAEAMQAIYEDVYLDDEGDVVSTYSLGGAWKQNRLQAKRSSETYASLLSSTNNSITGTEDVKEGVLCTLIDSQNKLAEQFRENAQDFTTEVQEEITSFKERFQRKVDAVDLSIGDSLFSRLEAVEHRIQQIWRKFCIRLSYRLYGVGVTISTNEHDKPIVSGIEPNSPAAIAGLKVNDVFIGVGDTSFTDDSTAVKPGDVAKLLRLTDGVSRIMVVVERKGKIFDLLVSKPIGQSFSAPPGSSGVGLAVYANDDGIIVVSDVEAGSGADDAGIRPGDIVKQIDGLSVDDGKASAEEVALKLSGPENSKVKVVIERGGKSAIYVLIREPVPLSPPKHKTAFSPTSVVSLSGGGSPTSSSPRNLAVDKTPSSDTWLLEMSYRLSVERQAEAWAQLLPEIFSISAKVVEIETDRRTQMPSLLLKFVPRQLPNCNFIHRGCLEKIADRFLDQDVENDINDNIQKQQKLRQKASTEHRSSILNKSRRKLQLDGNDSLKIDIPQLESDLSNDLLIASKILERQLKPKAGYGNVRWQKYLVVVTADLFMHYFDVPATIDESQYPTNQIFDMLKPSAACFPTFDDIHDSNLSSANKNELKNITPVETSYIPNCALAVISSSDTCSFEISEDKTGMFGTAATRKFILRTNTQEERDEWMKTLSGVAAIHPGKPISPSSGKAVFDGSPAGSTATSPNRRWSDMSPNSTSSSPFKGWRRSSGIDPGSGQGANDPEISPRQDLTTSSPKASTSPFREWSSPESTPTKDTINDQQVSKLKEEKEKIAVPSLEVDHI